ncbi:hypothetical protein [Marinoscillum sp.]|uniref:hypothetical protein n=1 Tax=Marinoscillum sp. TaxID=2024838 RepID=UPI003BAB2021
MKETFLTILGLLVFIGNGLTQTLTVPDNIGTSSNSGNVGIGTTTPTSKLSIRNVGGTDGVKLLDFSEVNDEEFVFKGNFSGTGSTGNQLYIGSGVSGWQSNIMTWRGDGHVGVGISNPISLFHIKENSSEKGKNAGLTVEQSGSGNALVQYLRTGEQRWVTGIDESQNNNFVIGRGQTWQNGKDLVIDVNGQIGIGTQNPFAILHTKSAAVGTSANDVKIGAKFEVGRQKLEFKSLRTANGTEWKNTTLKLQAIIDDTNHQSIDFVNDNNYLEHIDLYTGNQNFSTRFTYDGKVGIGTTIPDAKLTVDGNIHATEVKVDLLIPGPDYVFDEDYELLSLSATKSYIKENKHLPEIPSAMVMKENGIDLGDMNIKLLKKIEELTLHLIEQNERVEKLEKEIYTLKNQ